jgi:hypothetical protein
LSTWCARRHCCASGIPSTSGTNETFSMTVRLLNEFEVLKDEDLRHGGIPADRGA